MSLLRVIEYSENRFNTNEPVHAERTEKGFICPHCSDTEVTTTYVKDYDGTKRPDVGLTCKKCGKKWDYCHN